MSKRALIILIILAIVIFGYIGFIAVSLTLCDESYTMQSYITYTIEPGEKKIISEKLGQWQRLDLNQLLRQTSDFGIPINELTN
jgi:hypothetical protein